MANLRISGNNGLLAPGKCKPADTTGGVSSSWSLKPRGHRDVMVVACSCNVHEYSITIITVKSTIIDIIRIIINIPSSRLGASLRLLPSKACRALCRPLGVWEGIGSAARSQKTLGESWQRRQTFAGWICHHGSPVSSP